MEEYKKAEQYYVAALSLYKKSGRIEVAGSLYQNLGFVLQELGENLDALSCYIVSADICSRLGIPGWGNKSPYNARDLLLESLGQEADDFRVKPGNPEGEILKRASTRVYDYVNSILAANKTENGND